MMSKKNCQRLFERLQKANPNPTTELHYSNSFELLIAVMLSAQATDISVNKATGPLFQLAETPEAMYDLGEARLKRMIQTIGLFNTKAANVIKTCQILLDRHGGQVPEDRQSLENLPGVGRKTANVVLNTAFGQETLAVDTHIFRVAHRLGLAKGKTPLAVEQELLGIIPKAFLRDAHHWLILHGRYTCKARRPLCYACPLADLCPYPDKTPAEH